MPKSATGRLLVKTECNPKWRDQTIDDSLVRVLRLTTSSFNKNDASASEPDGYT